LRKMWRIEVRKEGSALVAIRDYSRCIRRVAAAAG
jgi:hypothetical protein